MPGNKLIYDEKILKQLSALLIKRKESVGTAESVTSGHLQLALSLAPNALNFFQGGITAYNLGQKTKHFEVDPIFAEACDCVSEEVAASMAASVHKLFNCDWGLAATGYASPIPEKNIKRLFACFAISHHRKIVLTQTIRCDPETPFKIGAYYTNSLLKDFVRALKKEE